MEVTIASPLEIRIAMSIASPPWEKTRLWLASSKQHRNFKKHVRPQAIQHHIYILINYAQFLVKGRGHQIIRTQQPNKCTFSEGTPLKSAPSLLVWSPETLVIEWHPLHLFPTYSVFARTFPKKNHFCLEMNQHSTSWWLNYSVWKICSSNWTIFPGLGVKWGEKRKSLSCHHLVLCHIKKQNWLRTLPLCFCLDLTNPW